MKIKLSNPFKQLNKFELILWLSSVTTIIVAFLIPKDKDVLTLIASVIGVTALIFIAKGKPIGQFLCIIFALFYGVVSTIFKYYGEMITYLFMSAPASLISFIIWLKNPCSKSDSVKVEKLTAKKIVLIVFTAISLTIAFYFILKAFDTPNLIFSTISVTTSVSASMLTIFRSPYFALCYAANDVILIVLWSLASAVSLSYIPMIICFVVFLINDSYSFISWLRLKKMQSNNGSQSNNEQGI